MIYNLVRVVAFESLITRAARQCTGPICFHMLFNFRCQRMALTVWDYGRANFSAALKNAHDGSLVFGTSSGDPATALREVHVSRFPPMKVSSASTSPESNPNPPSVKAKRKRWPMNHAFSESRLGLSPVHKS